MRQDIRDRYLPIDRDAFVAAEPPSGRVIVIAPTRAACETIELALGLHIETYLERMHGEHLRELARARKGFGIVAGTGTGKTLAIRPIAEELLGTTDLRVGVVNREREATPETPTWNVVIVTTGIARRWFQDGDILPSDTLIVDEIHQTSAELELCLALGKRVGCRFIWLSATVDPSFYSRYLDSSDVLEVYSFDPDKAARVKVVNAKPIEFLEDRFLQHAVREKRGVGMFLPTRAGVEEAAEWVGERFRRIHSAYYHGGEPVRVIRAFLEEDPPKPYFLAMTAAGQSALNVRGLDTVVIDDVRFANVIEDGKNVLTRLHLGANEILQMAGRVHGRVEGGRVFILSDRDIDFASLRPTEPDFQLAGDSERVALTCAALAVRADELDLPVPLDRDAYREAVKRLEVRGVVENGRLTRYGKLVEALPVERAWAELIVNADDDLLPYIAVASAIESLHRMTREDRNLEGLVIEGSDHLTAYNLYAEAFKQCGYVGEVYGLPRHLFDESIEQWAERRGVLVKAIEDAALAMASIYRSVGLELPSLMPRATGDTLRAFQELLAQFMPFDLVIDEQTRDGQSASVSKTSVCGSWGAVAGTLRYFADKWGVPRASIEGTQLPMSLVKRHATRGEQRLVYDPESRRTPLMLERKLEFFGFTLEEERIGLRDFTPELADEARRALADALAREEAHHPSVRRNRDAVQEVRELWRRSGGLTRRLSQRDLSELYFAQMGDINSVEEFRSAQFPLDLSDWVDPAMRERLLELPPYVELRGKFVQIDYDVEETPRGESQGDSPYRDEPSYIGVARLRIPEKLARNLHESELPSLDRPLRFMVARGQRGAVRANTLDELQDLLDMPWSPEESESEHPPNERNRHRGKGRGERGKGRNDRGKPRHDRGGSRNDGGRGRARGARGFHGVASGRPSPKGPQRGERPTRGRGRQPRPGDFDPVVEPVEDEKRGKPQRRGTMMDRRDDQPAREGGRRSSERRSSRRRFDDDLR